MKKIIALFLVVLMAVSLVACTQQNAKEEEFKYPTSTITIVVGYSAGGAMDMNARVFAEYAQKLCGQSVIVSNMAGASGAIAVQSVINGKTDGTIMLLNDPNAGLIPTKDTNVPFDIRKDLTYIGSQSTDARVLYAKSSRFATSEELVKYVTEHPGELTCGGTGAKTDAGMALRLAKEKGFDVKHVEYSGEADAKADFMGDHVDLLMMSASSVATAEPDWLTVAIFASERDDRCPNVPTLGELGYDVNWLTLRGYSMKAGTDQRIIDYWVDILQKVTADPEYQEKMANLGYHAQAFGADEYTKMIAERYETLDKFLNN